MVAPISPQQLAARQQMALHDNRSKLQAMLRYYRGNVELALCAYRYGTRVTDSAINIAVRGNDQKNWVSYLPVHMQGHVRQSIDHYRQRQAAQQKPATPQQADKNDARNEHMQALLKYYRGNIAHALAAFDAGTMATNTAIEHAISDNRPRSWVSYLSKETQDAVAVGMSNVRRLPHHHGLSLTTKAATAFSAEERAFAERRSLRALSTYFQGSGVKAMSAYHGGLEQTNRAIAKAERLGNHHNWLAYMPADTQSYVRNTIRKAQDISAARANMQMAA